jgi:hypothetical protein
MKKCNKRLITFISCVLTFQTCLCQNKKEQLFFLADTINTGEENKILKIDVEGAYRYYAFYCKCIPSYDRYPTFVHLFKNEKEILTSKPNVNYTSWKLLSELLYTKGKHFNDFYTLFIVQALINNKFMINETKLFIVPPPIIDIQKVH